MLKYLRIQNLILVEEATLCFQPGLNILTGETGSGKSAIMQALSLVMGERSDTSLIRKGCEKGFIEAIFETDSDSILQRLEEGGIAHESGEELVVRRELSLSGKGRTFVNHHTVQLAFLRKLGEELVQLVAQHANQALFSLDYHREVLDLFGDLQPLLQAFRECYHHERQIKERLDGLIHQEARRMREIDRYEQELEEIERAAIKEGEEEELFAEYTLLSNAEELSQKVSEINQNLTAGRTPLLPHLSRQKQLLDALLRFDPSLKNSVDAFQNALLELQEISYTLERYQNNITFDPKRLQFINERLTLINQMKRKYGPTIADMLTYRKEIVEKLTTLNNADVEIEQLRQQLQEGEKKTHKCAQELSARRTGHAEELAQAMTTQIQSLNMPKATFSIEVLQQPRTSEGDDRIEFFVHPNVGEHHISLKEGASGGEMSRVLLALQTLLAGKGKRNTLIFDEVDANIGGETATIVGEKLHEISRQHQVICITHFPQVAVKADHHFQISKEEKEGRTLTVVQELTPSARRSELTRMSGRSASGNRA